MELLKLMSTIIRERKILKENIQLADKVYFKTGKLSDEDKEIIIGVTGGDNYTKIISDIYIHLKENYYNSNQLSKQLGLLYNDIISYNKNVFPIIGFDINNPSNVNEIVAGLDSRRKIINEIKKLPSIAKRNLKGDIRKERTYYELSRYQNDLNYFMGYYSLLSNRDEDIQLKIARKMFKGNTTLEELMRFVDEKQNFLGGVEFTRKDIEELSESEDFDIIYKKDESMIVRVDSPQGIKSIGCNSLWCFTYGSGYDSAYRQWNEFSHNGIVYVLIDFREESDSEDFMHVLIKPLTDEDDNLITYNEDNEDDQPLYNMSNENYTNPYGVLEHLFGKDYPEIIEKYLNFDY